MLYLMGCDPISNIFCNGCQRAILEGNSKICRLYQTCIGLGAALCNQCQIAFPCVLLILQPCSEELQCYCLSQAVVDVVESEAKMP